MPVSVAAAIQFSLVAVTSIFFLVDPFAAIPAFLSMTDGGSPEHRRRMARRAAVTCFLVLSIFGLAGGIIFQLFGVTMPAFKIAGGVILMLIGLEMLQAKRSQTQETPGDAEECCEKDDVGIIPLGIPMLAGPGAISTVMVLVGQSPGWWHTVPVIGAIGLTAFSCYWILAAADRVRGYLGDTGIRVMMRLMGLLLTAIAVQFMLNGLTDVGLIKR